MNLETPFDYSKLNPVLTNIIYFILTVYSWCCIIGYRKTMNKSIIGVLFIFGLLSMLSGIFSILYHIKTPSFEIDPDARHSSEFENALNLDNGFAMTFGVWAVLVLIIYAIWSVWYFKNKKDQFNLFLDINFWVAILFIIISLLCYMGSGIFWRSSLDSCEEQNEVGKLGCFKTHQKEYNVYHSYWHIFSGFAGFFWILIVIGTMQTHISLKRIN